MGFAERSRITDLGNPRLAYDDMPKLEVSTEDYEAFKVEKGDFLFARSGAIGRYGIAFEDEEAIFASYLIRFQFKTTDLLNRFFGYVYESDIAQGQIRAISQGNANININADNIKSLQFPCPPLPEQKKIARILSTVDRKLELIDQQITATQTLKKGLMQKLFSEGVGTQDANGQWQPHTEFKDSELGRVPAGWEVSSFEEISQVTSSKRILRSEYQEEGVPFYRSKEIILKSKSERFDDEIFISKAKFSQLKDKFGTPEKGDLLISAVGTIGCCYLVGDEEFYFKDGNLIWLTSIKDRVAPEFLLHLINSDGMQEAIASISAGSSQSALTIVKLKTLNVPIPSQSEQVEINKILSTANRKLEHLTTQKAQTEQLKKGLMQKLLTGQA